MDVKLWSYKTGYLVESSPALAGGVVYVGSDDDYVYVLNATKGALLSNYKLGSPFISRLLLPTA